MTALGVVVNFMGEIILLLFGLKSAIFLVDGLPDSSALVTSELLFILV